MVAFAEEKGTIPPPPLISREDYLAWEDEQETKHEYDNGFIIEMAGAQWNHNLIAGRANGLLITQLLESDCEAVGSDMRVYIPQCNRYVYPDGSVMCGEPDLEIFRGVQTLLNPIVILEVLSKSTEKSDRGEKFECYKTLASLQTYVLISQTEPRIEVFERQASGEWTETVTEGRDATAKLERIGCELRIKDVFMPA